MVAACASPPRLANQSVTLPDDEDVSFAARLTAYEGVEIPLVWVLPRIAHVRATVPRARKAVGGTTLGRAESAQHRVGGRSTVRHGSAWGQSHQRAELGVCVQA